MRGCCPFEHTSASADEDGIFGTFFSDINSPGPQVAAPAELTGLSRFFRDTYTPFIHKTPVTIVILLLFLCMRGWNAWEVRVNHFQLFKNLIVVIKPQFLLF